MLGGKIKLESAKGKGSSFTVFIPLEIEKSQSVETPAAEPETVSAGITCKRILIVDDDTLQLKLLTEMLKRIDNNNTLTVKTTIHAAEALSAVDSFKPELMFVDIEMPEMSGTEVIGKIGKRQNLKVYAMTAHEPTIKDELLDKGFDGCLFKPFSISELAKVLHIDNIATDMKEETTDRFCQLTAFADGDKDAEKEIFSSYIAELENFISLLQDCGENDLRQTAAHVAHKSLPLMKMIGSEICGMLVGLSPENIGKLTDKDLTSKIKIIIREFRNIAGEMKERI